MQILGLLLRLVSQASYFELLPKKRAAVTFSYERACEKIQSYTVVVILPGGGEFKQEVKKL